MLVAGALSSDELDLDQVQRIDVGVAKLDGARERRVSILPSVRLFGAGAAVNLGALGYLAEVEADQVAGHSTVSPLARRRYEASR